LILIAGVLLGTLSFTVQEFKKMTAKPTNGQMDYIEFPATDISATKNFYSNVFGWKFTDYGPGYTSFEDGRMAGGFNKELQVAPGGPLVVLYGSDLEIVEAKVKAAGGKIVKEPFSFPGGRRFHFADPNGNELAVWSEK
jgi:uncharacterized protein